MTYLSVCSGIEAATVAWHPLGWTPVAFAEVDAFPSAVLNHHYPTVPNYGDVTKFHDWPDTAFDVLVGGTPCQSFSVAGLRKGLADPRGNLALTFLAIADRYRPRWVVWENVPGVLSATSHDAPDPCPPPPPVDVGCDGQEVESEDEYDAEEVHAFNCLLAGFSELGYFGAYGTLDAQYFNLAQRRARVFAVFHLGDWRRAAAVLFERESLSGHPAPRREAREGVAPTVSSGPPFSGTGNERVECDAMILVTNDTNERTNESSFCGSLSERSRRDWPDRCGERDADSDWGCL
jgi:DNA (cytosine-5)-methyltransferase 1